MSHRAGATILIIGFLTIATTTSRGSADEAPIVLSCKSSFCESRSKQRPEGYPCVGNGDFIAAARIAQSTVALTPGPSSRLFAPKEPFAAVISQNDVQWKVHYLGDELRGHISRITLDFEWSSVPNRDSDLSYSNLVRDRCEVSQPAF